MAKKKDKDAYKPAVPLEMVSPTLDTKPTQVTCIPRLPNKINQLVITVVLYTQKVNLTGMLQHGAKVVGMVVHGVGFKPGQRSG